MCVGGWKVRGVCCRGRERLSSNGLSERRRRAVESSRFALLSGLEEDEGFMWSQVQATDEIGFPLREWASMQKKTTKCIFLFEPKLQQGAKDLEVRFW